MRLFNYTPYGVAPFVKQFEPGEPFITIVVVGIFELVPDGPCSASPKERQVEPGPAQFFQDKVGNSRYADGDGAPFKPQADCLFVGSGHAPGGKPVTHLDVTFGVGALRKTLRLVGDRSWVRLPGGSVGMTEPAPFTRMPVRSELAHGGPRSRYNRHGKGLGKLGNDPGSKLPMANVFMDGEDAPSFDEDGPSAGFGALAPELLPRSALRGTHDDDWLYRRKPLPPQDFDPAFFNSARADQCVDGYLRGDEELYFENLHPTRPVFRSRLPGIDVRIFAHHLFGHDKPEIEEVRTVLDTCLVDMSAGTVRLAWRGTMHGKADAGLEQLDCLMIVEESLDAPQDRSVYIDQLFAGMKLPDGPSMTEADEAKVEEINRRALADAVAALRKHGLDEALVAEVEAKTTVQEALDVMARVAEDLRKTLPGAD